MDFHPKDLPISKTYDVKNENEAVQAVEDMVNLGFKDKNAGYKVLMPKETKIAKRIGYTVTTGVTKGLREKMKQEISSIGRIIITKIILQLF